MTNGCISGGFVGIFLRQPFAADKTDVKVLNQVCERGTTG